MATMSQLAAALTGFLSYEEMKDEEPTVLTIASAENESVGQGSDKDIKPTLSFKEIRKKLILNKTRHQQLRAIVGDKDPAGTKIIVAAEPTQVGNRVFNMVVIKPVEA